MDVYERAYKLRREANELLRGRPERPMPTGVDPKHWRPPPVAQPVVKQEQQNNWADWDRWAEAHVRRVLEEQVFTRGQTDAIGQALSMLRSQLRKEFEAALGQLRADVHVQVGVAKGEIAMLKKDATDAAYRSID